MNFTNGTKKENVVAITAITTKRN